MLHAGMAIEDRQATGITPYERLRVDIVHGSLRPNQRLVEVELADRFGVSRTPVREALQRLVLEGLVRRDRGGWVVHEHSPEEIRAIYEVRAALEGYAAFLAATRADEDELRELDGLYPGGEEAYALGPDDQVELNERFHDGVIAAAGNAQLTELCSRNRQYYFNHRIASRYDDEETRRSIEGHRQILAAIGRGDAAAAEAHARDHVGYALAILLDKVA
jgi:DNA-binding GntR family transcriptional regulator